MTLIITTLNIAISWESLCWMSLCWVSLCGMSWRLEGVVWENTLAYFASSSAKKKNILKVDTWPRVSSRLAALFWCSGSGRSSTWGPPAWCRSCWAGSSSWSASCWGSGSGWSDWPETSGPRPSGPFLLDPALSHLQTSTGSLHWWVYQGPLTEVEG